MKLNHVVVDNLLWIFFAIMAITISVKIWFRTNHQKSGKKKLKKAVDSNLHEPLSLHPRIETSLCIGCGACTTACPEGDILKLINHKAVLVSPAKCVGHGECEVACPMGAIDLVFGTKTRGMDIPRVSSNYESNIPGLYIAGELGGMGLIRNAVKQGRAAAEHAINNLKSNAKTDYDILIVGAGPAGFAASLAAHNKKLRYRCIDQNTFGGTIANFPRQKLVMSHPFELPMVGVSKFKGNIVSKEEILSLWKETRLKTGIQIYEGEKFESIEQAGSFFNVRTSKGVFSASKVILAMGVRGSPRKLGVPGEDSQKVTYNLIDPSQYQNKKIAVVGGGNAGAEVAQMLASHNYNNTVSLLVRGASFDRCNEENQKRLKTLSQQNRLDILFNSSVDSISPDSITIISNGVQSRLENDFVFVMAGAELPHKFLMSIGIKIDKKFEEGLRKT